MASVRRGSTRPTDECLDGTLAIRPGIRRASAVAASASAADRLPYHLAMIVQVLTAGCDPIEQPR